MKRDERSGNYLDIADMNNTEIFENTGHNK